MLLRITGILSSAGNEGPPLRPTFHNESWMLKLFINAVQYSGNHLTYPLRNLPGARWSSEALFPSSFLARFRSDPLTEGWSNVDAVIGQFDIPDAGKGDLKLRKNAFQLVVAEAKMFTDYKPSQNKRIKMIEQPS